MFERVLSIKFVTLKNSFICLPASFKYLKTGSYVQLIYGENEVAYFSVTTQTEKLDDNSVGISSLYAKALGIKENEFVTLSEIPQLPTVNSITIAPLNNNDYEVLEMLAENVQSTLLDQIRVVNCGQKFVVWIGVNINVLVCAEDVKPQSPGVLDFLTEVVIKPKNSDQVQRNSLKKTVNSQEKSVFNMEGLKTFQNFLNCQIENGTSLHFSKFKDDLIYRLVPIKELPFLEKINKHRKLFNVFASRQNLPVDWCVKNTLITPIFCSLKLLCNEASYDKINHMYVRLCVFEDFTESGDFTHLGVENLFVDDILCETFGVGSRVVIEYIENIPNVNEINIHTDTKNLSNVVDVFKTYLADNTKDDIFLLNSNIVINIGKNIRCSLTFTPVEAEFCVVNSQLLKNCKYITHEKFLLTETDVNNNKLSCDKFISNVSNYQIIINEVVSHFCVADNNWGNILITGKPGSGKSTLLKLIEEKLQSYPDFVYVKVIHCKTIKGKTMDSLFKTIATAFSDLILYQPSVLILDDLNILCENVSGDDNLPNAVYSNRISEMLHNFLNKFLDFNKIGICATAENLSKLNTNIYTARGSHLFKNLYSIDNFSKADRIELLKHLFANCTMVDVNFDEWAVKTDGFVIQDMVDFYNKTIFEVYKDQNDDDNSVEVSNKHLEKALKNTCILSLQNVQFHSPGSKNFSDIGGLHDVKKILMESLLWPAQYPGIFANAPLRLQSGLLLYGPPGTGKTQLAAAAAKHCGLRLIAIKGPELLSKYVGASEQAVRDVFQKAQSARPCILFFDEFDSLAPRRGHDDTGVTDRVVNQLLTQLDGVESLSGVCVLAATSRPDLLDPALLRPGRLDKQILCPLPDKDERLEILEVLSKNLDLSSDVDFEFISSSTEGFSGADLQSVLYTAQLSTVDHLLDNTQDTSIQHNPQITQKHLEDALSKTRPSLTRQERLKYEKIYARFQGDPSMEDFRPGSKATLA